MPKSKPGLTVILVFFSLITGPFIGVRAQSALSVDSSSIVERKPSTSLSDLKKDRDYQYGFEKISPVNSWWDQLSSYFRKWYDDFFNNKSYGTYRKFAVYLLLMLILVFFISKVLGVQLIAPFQRRDPGFDLAYYSEKETIHGRDFNKEVEEAVRNADFKLAVRLYYLKTLKQLSEKGLINWQPNKTNRSYYEELRPGIQGDFGRLTAIFEYCWYGNFQIRKDDFDEIRSTFEHFNQSSS